MGEPRIRYGKRTFLVACLVTIAGVSLYTQVGFSQQASTAAPAARRMESNMESIFRS